MTNSSRFLRGFYSLITKGEVNVHVFSLVYFCDKKSVDPNVPTCIELAAVHYIQLLVLYICTAVNRTTEKGYA